MRNRLLALLYLVVCPALSHAISGDDLLVVTRFAGFPDGKGATMGVMERKNGVWRSNDVRTIGDSTVFRRKTAPGPLDCFRGALDSLFGQAQLMAFNKYVETGYFTREEAIRYMNNSVSITDRPITFYNILSQEKPPLGLNALTGDPESALRYSLKGPLIDKEGFVTASLYSVSGQKLVLTEAGDFPKIEQLELPWMKDPDFAEAAKYLFSRDKYPLIWELGRAATTDIHEFPHLLAMAGQDIAAEALHYGVPSAEYLDHAYVSAEFLSQENTDKFAKLFGEHLFLRAPDNPGKTVFIVPLKKYLENFPPRRYETAHKLLHEAKVGLEDGGKSQQLIEMLKYAQHVNLDLRLHGKNLASPIVFSSYLSGTTYIPTDAIFALQGIDRAGFDRVRAASNGPLYTRGLTIDMPWPGKLLDPSSAHLLPGKFDGFPMQISNLDPKLAKSDPLYIPSVLSGAFDHLARQFFGQGEIKAHQIQPLVDELKRANGQFILTTHYPETAEVIRRYKPRSEKQFEVGADVHTGVVWSTLGEPAYGGLKRPGTKLYTFSFDFDQIGQMRYLAYQSSSMDPKKIPLARPGYFWWLQGVSEP